MYHFRWMNTTDTVSGISPLMAAVIGGQKHCVHEMLMKNARIDVADIKGVTVYHYAVKHLPEVLDVGTYVLYRFMKIYIFSRTYEYQAETNLNI